MKKVVIPGGNRFLGRKLGRTSGRTRRRVRGRTLLARALQVS